MSFNQHFTPLMSGPVSSLILNVNFFKIIVNWYQSTIEFLHLFFKMKVRAILQKILLPVDLFFIFRTL